MTVQWVAGTTRARILTSRGVGETGQRQVAAGPSLGSALRYLTSTAYRRGLDPDASLADAQRAVTTTLLWHLRVLAGWQPRAGADAIRALASGFEIANVEAHLRSLLGGEPAAPAYPLGALATDWPRLARTRSPTELRAGLAASAWGDPGGETPAAVATGLRIAAAARVTATVPAAAGWATARLALVVARERFLAGRPLTDTWVRRAAGPLGRAALAAGSFTGFRDRLPDPARWVVADLPDPGELWRGETRWWQRVASDGAQLVRHDRPGPAPVVGAVAVLSSDAHRVRAALEVAVRGGGPVEALDAAG